MRYKGDTISNTAKSGLIFALFLAVLLAFSASAQAAYYITGIVNDADNNEPADGRMVSVYRHGYESEDITGTISDNLYLVDCEMLDVPCNVGDTLKVRVVNPGDGYQAGPVEVVVSGNGYDQAPDITLEYSPVDISLATNKDNYILCETVTISGTLYDNLQMAPIAGADVGIFVENIIDTPLKIFQVTTDSEGNFKAVLNIGCDAETGVYDVYASYNYGNGSITETKSFSISEEHKTMTTTVATGGGSSGGGGSGGGFICTPEWECTEWSVCSGEIETRECTDANKCGINSSKPEEERDCSEGVVGGGSCSTNERICEDNVVYECHDSNWTKVETCSTECVAGECVNTGETEGGNPEGRNDIGSGTETSGLPTGLFLTDPATSWPYWILIIIVIVLIIWILKRRSKK